MTRLASPRYAARNTHATAHDRYLTSPAPIPMRPVAAPPSLVRVEHLSVEALLEFLGVGRFGETIHMKPFAVVHNVAAGAEREVLTEPVNHLVAAAFTQARWQDDLMGPAPVIGRRRQLAFAPHVRTAA